MKIRTEALPLNADNPILSIIKHRVAKLKTLFGNIDEAQIILREEKSNVLRDKIAMIKIKSQNSIIFVKEESKTFEAAFGKAYVMLKRQLTRTKKSSN